MVGDQFDEAIVATAGTRFPINTHHQRMATQSCMTILESQGTFFQSIGVTKDWRRESHRTLSAEYYQVSNQ